MNKKIKIFNFLIVLFLALFLISCNNVDNKEEPQNPIEEKDPEENKNPVEEQNPEEPIEEISQNEITIETCENVFLIGQTFSLRSFVGTIPVYYESSNNEIVKIQSSFGYALSVGAVITTAYSRYDDTVIDTFLVTVINNTPTSITLSGDAIFNVGDQVSFYYTITPSNSSDNVVWSTSDPEVVRIDENGKMTAVGSGLVTIKVSSSVDSSIYDEVTFWVNDITEYTNDSVTNKTKESKETIDASSLSGVMVPIIQKARSYIIGVNGYKTSRNTEKLSTSGTGTIFKRYCVLKDGTEVLDDGTITEFSCYKYYVITCKHLIASTSKVTVYYDDTEFDAKIIAYDEKIDLGVITFMDTKYYPVAQFGDSDLSQTGEFVIAVGNTYGAEYVDSASLGIISYNGRYVSTDTDGDQTNDWDALYIQHDAAIGEGSSGGPLVNMKGEIIGINSEMISAEEIDNMAFAIPSNLVLELCNQLAVGIVPSRPLLKISVLSVKDIISSNYLLDYYPIPEGITYGMFVAEVEIGGVGDIAGMLPGDIIVEFDGLRIAYSYELRAALGEVIIGSNEEVNIVVYRDGEYVTLKAVF